MITTIVFFFALMTSIIIISSVIIKCLTDTYSLSLVTEVIWSIVPISLWSLLFYLLN